MITANASGLIALQARVATIQKAIQPTLQKAVNTGGIKASQDFGKAAPVGKSEGNAIPGDAPGKLSQSFQAKPISVSNGAGVTILTIQPVKLKFVRYGTGIYNNETGHRIYPLHAKALYWQGAAHPYRSIAGMRPNDFISPAISVAKQDIRDSITQAMRLLLGGL